MLFQKPLLCRRIVDNRLEDACGRLMPAPFSANQRKTTSRGTCSNVVHAGPNLISTCWIANAGFAHSVYYLRKPRGFSQGTTALQLPPMCSMEMWSIILRLSPLGFKLQEAPTTSKDSCKSCKNPGRQFCQNFGENFECSKFESANCWVGRIWLLKWHPVARDLHGRHRGSPGRPTWGGKGSFGQTPYDTTWLHMTQLSLHSKQITTEIPSVQVHCLHLLRVYWKERYLNLFPQLSNNLVSAAWLTPPVQFRERCRAATGLRGGSMPLTRTPATEHRCRDKLPDVPCPEKKNTKFLLASAAASEHDKGLRMKWMEWMFEFLIFFEFFPIGPPTFRGSTASAQASKLLGRWRDHFISKC